MIEFQVGDRIELQDGIDRLFGNGEEGEHGVIRSFFSAPLGDVTGVQYAEIAWDDGSVSSVPLQVLEFEDTSDDLWMDGTVGFEDDDLDLEGLF